MLICRRRSLFLYVAVILGVCVAIITYTKVNSLKHEAIKETSISASTTQSMNLRILESPKVIYAATHIYTGFEDISFGDCEYRNCIIKTSRKFKTVKNADVVIFQYSKLSSNLSIPKLTRGQRASQIWLLETRESQTSSKTKLWNPQLVDGLFNGLMTFRRDSLVYFPWGVTKLRATQDNNYYDYAARKTKAAFAYVSNCQSENYNRLEIMQKLKAYIEIDIFGSCTNNQPCARMNYTCETVLHTPYRFYLSFENSLCEDYITEKFWSRLNSPGAFLPVVIGGTTLLEYYRVAPPNSFIHAYNFTSLKELGEYLNYLVHNNEAYNRYHEWRSAFEIITDKNSLINCQLCKLAHKKPDLPIIEDLAYWWNDRTKCKMLN